MILYMKFEENFNDVWIYRRDQCVLCCMEGGEPEEDLIIVFLLNFLVYKSSHSICTHVSMSDAKPCYVHIPRIIPHASASRYICTLTLTNTIARIITVMNLMKIHSKNNCDLVKIPISLVSHQYSHILWEISKTKFVLNMKTIKCGCENYSIKCILGEGGFGLPTISYTTQGKYAMSFFVYRCIYF